jgi:uncharacterized protein (TIGR02246 family)
MIRVLESGWNSHDMTLYMSVISRDANFVNVNGWWWRGHTEIKGAHIRAHETAFKVSKAEVMPRKIRFLKPDVAIAHAAWKVFGDVRSAAARDYVMTLVLRKNNGREPGRPRVNAAHLAARLLAQGLSACSERAANKLAPQPWLRLFTA